MGTMAHFKFLRGDDLSRIRVRAPARKPELAQAFAAALALAHIRRLSSAPLPHVPAVPTTPRIVSRSCIHTHRRSSSNTHSPAATPTPSHNEFLHVPGPCSSPSLSWLFKFSLVFPVVATVRVLTVYRHANSWNVRDPRSLVPQMSGTHISFSLTGPGRDAVGSISPLLHCGAVLVCCSASIHS